MRRVMIRSDDDACEGPPDMHVSTCGRRRNWMRIGVLQAVQFGVQRDCLLLSTRQ